MAVKKYHSWKLCSQQLTSAHWICDKWLNMTRGIFEAPFIVNTLLVAYFVETIRKNVCTHSYMHTELSVFLVCVIVDCVYFEHHLQMNGFDERVVVINIGSDNKAIFVVIWGLCELLKYAVIPIYCAYWDVLESTYQNTPHAKCIGFLITSSDVVVWVLIE